MAVNHLLLGACICIVVGAIFHFFYLNRFVAWLLALAIRVLYWRQGPSSIWIDIGAIHFSILTGRILVKDVRYHSSNQTIKIVKGQIQWKYWLRKPLGVDEMNAARKTGAHSPSSCRIQISFHGFEWLIYNRTAAYDAIVEQLTAQQTSRAEGKREPPQKAPVGHSEPLFMESVRRHTPKAVLNSISWLRRQLPNLDPLELLPLGFDVLKGAIVIGNASTPNLLVSQFQKAEGTYGITESISIHDHYKSTLNLTFQDAQIHFVSNDNYYDTLSTMGEELKSRSDNDAYFQSHLDFTSFGKIWRQLRLFKYLLAITPAKSRRYEPKISRKSKEGDNFNGDFLAWEYAIERQILEAHVLELYYYVDVPGLVPRSGDETPTSSFSVGNGGSSDPEWGVDIVIRSGKLKYGPWADRQRAELQKVFFPPIFADTSQTERLQPGDQRLWTSLKVFIELREVTSLTVPFRESSKDWQWDRPADDLFERSKTRDPAWLYITSGDNSTITYVLPFITGPDGYDSRLEVHLDTVAVTSSLNDIHLLNAESCRIYAGMPAPLKWNAERIWTIGLSLRQNSLYLLRDHVNMITDLGKDWTSGPPADFFRFVPVLYDIQYDLTHFALSLCANDHNIIDKPLVKGENAMFHATGDLLSGTASIPSNIFRPNSTTIPFDMSIEPFALSLALPRWNTNALHMPSDGNSIAHARAFEIKGSYCYMSDVCRENVEQLKLELTFDHLAYKLLGWTIRHFMALRNNYLGSFTHFSTLGEYLHKRKNGIPPGDPVVQKYREGTSNMMDVDLSLLITHGSVILPAGIPGYSFSPQSESASESSVAGVGPCLLLTLNELQVAFRMHDFFMELSLNISPLSGRMLDDHPEEVVPTGHRKHMPSPTILAIDGVNVTAHKLFGPNPQTLTYVCVWEVDLGQVSSSLTASDAVVLSACIKSFLHNFTDVINAPASEYMPPDDPDVTILRVSIQSGHILWRARKAGALLTLNSGVHISSNDFGGQNYRKATSIEIPEVSVRILSKADARNAWVGVAELNGDAFLDIYDIPVQWKADTIRQSEFVAEQDRPTARVKQFLGHLRGEGMARPLFRNNVYLPGLYLSDKQAEALPLKSKPPSVIHRDLQSSDSDGDHDRIRDDWASRVQSRDKPNTSEEDTDSAEESDNDGLTDGDGSFDEHLEATNEDDGSFRDYVRFMNYYLCGNALDISTWKGSPLALHRSAHSLFSSAQQSDCHSDMREVTAELPDKEDCTIVRVTACQPISLSITPPILLALAELESDVVRVALRPPLQIDALMFSFLKHREDTEKAPSSDIFEICVPMVQVSYLQRPAYLTQPSKAEVCLFQADCHSLCLVLESHGTTSFSIGQMTIQLLAAPGIRDPLLSFTLQGMFLKLEKRLLDMTVNMIDGRVTHDAPASVAALHKPLMTTMSDAQALYERWQAHTHGSLSDMISKALAVSSADDNVDPLSAVQPSYLVQGGTPYRLRTSPVFRFLYHLRYLQVGKFASSGNKLLSLVESRMALFDGGVSDIDETMRLLGEPESHASTEPTSYAPQHAVIHLASASVSILDPLGKAFSGMTTSALIINLRSRRADLLTGPMHRGETPVSPSQASISLSKTPPAVRLVSLAVSLGDTFVTVYPHLLGFAYEVLQVRTSFAPSKGEKTIKFPKPAGRGADLSETTHIDATICVHYFCARAMADNLMVELGTSSFLLSSSISAHPSQRATLDISSSHSLLAREFFLRARSTDELKRERQQDILAGFSITKTRIHVSFRRQSPSPPQTRVSGGLENIHLHVPRSALRLYRFIEGWRADFLPEVERMAQALLTEIQKTPPLAPKRAERPVAAPSIQIDIIIDSMGAFLQVMRGTWLTVEARKISAFATSSKAIAFGGLKIMALICSISTGSHPSAGSSKTRLALKMPPISLYGRRSGSRITVDALVEFLRFKIKPSHWDTLFAVQQKFGQDFNELLSVVEETRKKRQKHATEEVSRSKPTPDSAQSLNVFIQMKGLRIGLEGLSSTVYLECKDIAGRMDTAPRNSWSIELKDLSLSLASGLKSDPVKRSGEASSESHRAALVNIDFVMSGGDSKHPRDMAATLLKVAITRMHAVMQPSSIGELVDLIDHVKGETLLRKEERSEEMAAFKQRTQSLLKTFEVKPSPSEAADIPPWLSKSMIDISICNVGFAFPLTNQSNELVLPRKGSSDSATTRAFLFSIHSISFNTQRGETGQVTLTNLSFQFVPSFNQSISNHFNGENHETCNRLLYPEMKAKLRTSGHLATRRILLKADVSGFVLDLDPSISDYAFALSAVYRQGKERVAQLSTSIPGSSPDISFSPGDDDSPSASNALPTSNILGSLTFRSGKVRMFSKDRVRPQVPAYSPFSETMDDDGAEIFKLPVVSVWAEYRGTPTARKPSDSQPSILMFKSTIHSSENKLKPSLLPFFSQLLRNIETHLRDSPADTSPSASLSPLSEDEPSDTAMSYVQISFSLRIDLSTLVLAGDPDNHVDTALQWESGGFMINVSPGARNVTFTGSVGGLRLTVKHRYMPEPCVEVDARNLTFLVAFTKLLQEDGKATNTLSVALDTELLGGLRFARFQDVLCFKALWLDQIPVFNASRQSRNPKALTHQRSNDSLRQNEITTIIVLQVRQVKLEVDFGKSISTVVLDLRKLLMRSKLSESINDVSVLIEAVDLQAEGNISGSASVPDVMFHTTRIPETGHVGDIGSKPRMLEIQMTSGTLIATVESDSQKLVHYRAEPIGINIYDDWSQVSSDESQRPLQLAFVVNSPEINAFVTVSAIPKVMMYGAKFQDNLDQQRDAASQESATYRATLVPRSETLSAVAEAMIQSARTRFHEAESGSIFVIRQHMSLRLDLLRLVVFARSMADNELAQFVGRNVSATLDRVVGSDKTSATKDIRLSFTSMVISRFSRSARFSRILETEDWRRWLQTLLRDASEDTIVGLPSMTMHMDSEEFLENGNTIVKYIFHSKFNHLSLDDAEDIFITLNLSLYLWLTSLRKSLTRELNDTRARTMSAAQIVKTTSNAPVMGKRKKPDQSLSVDAVAPSPPLGGPLLEPSGSGKLVEEPHAISPTLGQGGLPSSRNIIYRHTDRKIERLTMRQLGEATPDVMHPFFMKKAGFSLEDSLPQYVNEYATTPLEQIMDFLLNIYSKQLLASR